MPQHISQKGGGSQGRTHPEGSMEKHAHPAETHIPLHHQCQKSEYSSPVTLLVKQQHPRGVPHAHQQGAALAKSALLIQPGPPQQEEQTNWLPMFWKLEKTTALPSLPFRVGMGPSCPSRYPKGSLGSGISTSPGKKNTAHTLNECSLQGPLTCFLNRLS